MLSALHFFALSLSLHFGLFVCQVDLAVKVIHYQYRAYTLSSKVTRKPIKIHFVCVCASM